MIYTTWCYSLFFVCAEDRPLKFIIISSWASFTLPTWCLLKLILKQKKKKKCWFVLVFNSLIFFLYIILESTTLFFLKQARSNQTLCCTKLGHYLVSIEIYLVSIEITCLVKKTKDNWLLFVVCLDFMTWLFLSEDQFLLSPDKWYTLLKYIWTKDTYLCFIFFGD